MDARNRASAAARSGDAGLAAVVSAAEAAPGKNARRARSRGTSQNRPSFHFNTPQLEKRYQLPYNRGPAMIASSMRRSSQRPSAKSPE